MTNVKEMVKCQGQKVKKSLRQKILSQGIIMWIIKALALTIQMLLIR